VTAPTIYRAPCKWCGTPLRAIEIIPHFEDAHGCAVTGLHFVMGDAMRITFRDGQNLHGVVTIHFAPEPPDENPLGMD
jgi:hypothetical protein